MARQIWKLTALQLCNLFNFNEFRYTKDKKKKGRYLAVGITWMILILLLLFYIIIMDNVYLIMGMPQIVPLLGAVLVSLVILFFAMFKAGSVIFQMKGYEMLSALPVSKTAVIVSRFLSMYVTNLFFSLLVMLPGIVLYGMYQEPGIDFYLLSLVGTILLPLLPMTLAVILGAVITGISARMKHKSLVSAALSMLVVLAVILFSFQADSMEGSIDEEMMRHLSELLMEQMRGIYPPAVWFTEGVTEGAYGMFFLFAAVSVGIFVLMAVILSRFFSQICTALQSHESGKTADISKLRENSVRKALYQKEWKRYLSSSIYVVNTALGDILMAVFGVAVFFADTEKLEETLQMPGIVAKVLPFMLAVMPAIMSTTSCTISMEGKQWWLVKSLPVRTKDVLDSKILVNLTIALPCYVIAEIFACLAIKTTFLGYVLLLLVPIVYILFISVAGLSANLAFPVFDWENETAVVKQGASVFITMLTGFATVGIPLVLLLLVRDAYRELFCIIIMILLMAVTALLYRRNVKTDFRRLG